MTPAAHEYKGVGDAFLVYLLWLVPYALWLLVTCEILLSGEEGGFPFFFFFFFNLTNDKSAFDPPHFAVPNRSR